jgi:hypothetical protein
VDPHKYGVDDTSWTLQTRVVSFVFNVRGLDFRPSEQKKSNPDVLDFGFCEALLPALSPNLATAKHIFNRKNKLLGREHPKRVGVHPFWCRFLYQADHCIFDSLSVMVSVKIFHSASWLSASNHSSKTIRDQNPEIPSYFSYARRTKALIYCVTWALIPQGGDLALEICSCPTLDM